MHFLGGSKFHQFGAQEVSKLLSLFCFLYLFFANCLVNKIINNELFRYLRELGILVSSMALDLQGHNQKWYGLSLAHVCDIFSLPYAVSMNFFFCGN